MVSKKTMNTLLASAVALTIAGGVGTAQAMDSNKEKCYGVAKAGQNDCANAAKTHSCAGHAATDGEGGEWIAVPKGLCAKLVGGSTAPIMADASAAKDMSAKAVETVKEKAGDMAKDHAKGMMDKHVH